MSARQTACQGAAGLGAAALLLAMSACSDGYPTQSQVAASAHNLTQSQRLAAMNRLGRDAHPDRRWRYDLISACDLRVTVSGDKEASFHVRLNAATVGQSSERGPTYLVIVTPAGSAASAVQMFDAPRWTDSVEMFSHVRLQQRDCLQPRAAPPG